LSRTAPSSIRIERGECKLRSAVDDSQQRPRGALRRALALFPVPHRVDGHANPPGERDLGQADPAADATCVSGSITQCLGLVLSNLGGDLLFGGRVDARPVTTRRDRPLGTVGQNLDDGLVGFQAGPYHSASSRAYLPYVPR
jgi:hypothetical protein